MKKICEKCGEKFNVVDNPSCRTEGLMIIKRGRWHKTEKLCAKCWKKSREKIYRKYKNDE